MLRTKNLKVAEAAFLMIIGVWGVTAAHAELDLTSKAVDLAGNDPMHNLMVYASETVSTKDFIQPKATDGGFTVNAMTGVELPVSTGGAYYLRYDIWADEGGAVKFMGAPAVAIATNREGTVSRMEDSNVIFTSAQAKSTPPMRLPSISTALTQ